MGSGFGLRVSGVSVVLGVTVVVDDVGVVAVVEGASVTSGDADWEHEATARTKTTEWSRMG